MKKRSLSLVTLSVLLLLLLCLPLSSCSNEQGETVTLYVYNWGEYISDGSEDSLNVNDEFENYCKETLGLNVKVNYSTFSSNEDMYAKVSSGAAAYDVIVPSDYMIQRMISEQLLLPLDLSKIPNYSNISEDFKGEHVYYEPQDGNVYSIPYAYGMIGIIYNTETVPADHPTVGSWDLMWDPSFRGDILQFNNSRDAFGTALYKLGYDVNDASDEQWQEALELLMAQKDLVQGYVMDEIFNKMQSGSAAVAAYYAGDYLSMYEDNDALAFYYPKEGTNLYVDALCVPHNAQNPSLAMEYINFMCSKEIAIANAEYHYYASPNDAVVNDPEYREYMESIHEDAMDILYGSAEEVESSAYLNLSTDKLVMLNNLWEELKGANSVGVGIYVCCGVIVLALILLGVAELLRRRRWNKLYD